MSGDKDRAELLAALHASGAASEDDERELEAMLEADPSLEAVVREFQDSIAALATSFEPLKTSPQTLNKIKKEIAGEKRGVLARIRGWFSGE